MTATPKGRFQPGKSGNPGGRPKAALNVRDAARAHTELAILTLAEIAGDATAAPAPRVAAALGLLDRGWGKPLQETKTELSGPDGAPLPTGITVTFVRPEAA